MTNKEGYWEIMIDLSNEIMVHKRKEGVEFLQFRKLLEYPRDCALLYIKGK